MENLLATARSSVALLHKSVTVTQAEIGSQKKRDIAYVITSLLEPYRKYSTAEIERLIRDNVRPVILEIPGLAADHIRLSMIECGFVCRDARTNETWVAPDFSGDHDHYSRISKELKIQADQFPDQEFECPQCSLRLRARTLYTHYVNKHAGPERWEQIVDAYFGWI